MRRHRPSPTSIIAVAALFVALGGTAIAASHYVITSSSQIKPSVLRELRASDAYAAEVKPAAAGVHAVRARARSVGPVTATTTPTQVADPLTGGTWKQGAEELDETTGQVTITVPPEAQCKPHGFLLPVAFVTLSLDGVGVGTVDLYATEHEETVTSPFSLAEQFEPGKATTHTLTVSAYDVCESGGGHVTINSVSIDVIGLK